MRSVFIVETPLQLLNAIEAQFSLQLGDCVLILLLSEPFPKGAFTALLQFGKWTRVDYFRLPRKTAPVELDALSKSMSDRVNEYLKESKQLVKRLRFDRLAVKLKGADNLVLGNLLQGYMRHLANRVKPKHVYLLDDGTDTLRVSALRKAGESGPPSAHASLIRRMKDRLRGALLDWDSRQVPSVTFFTSYDLDLTPEDGYVRNSYAFCRQRLGKMAAQDAVYFLGQPLVEDGYLKPSTYLTLLAKAAANYRGRNLLYLTHRRESKANVAAIRAMGISVSSFDLPIEVQMLTGGLPQELCSFFSSALDNSRIIFGSNLKITAFKIPAVTLCPGHDFVAAIYDYLDARSGADFKVMDL